MAQHHRYVFDQKKRKLIGDFEGMYRDEIRKHFDSWHQDDSRHLHRRVALALLQDYNFGRIVDIGCGKGAFTHQLKKVNNEVIAVDVSPTAVKRARAKFPDVRFVTGDANDPLRMERLLRGIGEADLIVCSEVLAYLSRWRELLRVVSKHAGHLLVSLYIPEDPIGAVKSEEQLLEEIESRYEVVEHVSFRKLRAAVVLARPR